MLVVLWDTMPDLKFLVKSYTFFVGIFSISERFFVERGYERREKNWEDRPLFRNFYITGLEGLAGGELSFLTKFLIVLSSWFIYFMS